MVAVGREPRGCRRALAALEAFKMSTVLLFTLAILALFALATVAPTLLRLRIRFFKWIHWTWAAHVTEEHFERWVLVLRIVLLVLAVALLFFGVATAL